MATIETGTQNSAPKRARDEEIGSGPVNDKRWPGWPGENVFRLLVPTQKVGGIIGRKGEFVKKMCEETKSRIKILDGVSGAPERIVMVSAKEEPEAALSPAMDGVLQVHKLLVEGANAPGEAGRAQQGWSGTILTRMLLAGMQSGSLIGKQGATIKTIQESSGASARVIEDVPPYALSDDKVLEIQGDSTKVHKALELVLAHLRKFLVDRSVLPLFEMNTPKGHQPQMEQPPPHQPWNPNQASSMPPVGGNGYGNNANYAPSMPQHDSYYPPADMPPLENHPHHGLSMYGREPPHAGVPPMVNQQQPVIQQVTKRMQIPLSYADAVIGTNGANISYCRRNSGSVITIEETRGVPGEMTVEIIGTASQVQTAQQLIQNYIASASAPPSDPYPPPMDQGYNSYPSHNPVYGSSPHIAGHTGPPGYASHTGHAGHAAHTGHPAGPYESSYPGSYRY